MRLLDENRLKQNINEAATYDLDSNNVYGSSYFVWQKGGIVFKKHFGFAGPDTNIKTDDSTMYRLASMTKPITAVAMLILSDRGLISLDDPISKYIPEFEGIHIITSDGIDIGKSKTSPTVLHCLTHTSGIGSEKPVVPNCEERKTISATLGRFIDAGLDFEPFTKQAYSPYAAFDSLAYIAEKVTGQDYGDFLKNEIFIPCNMPDTTFSPTCEQWNRFVTMHNKVDGKNDVGITYPDCIFEKFPCSHKLAGAGLVSTLNDYSNFARMLLNNGEINNHKILSEQAIKALSMPYVPGDIMPGNENWGLGVRVITDNSYPTLSAGSYGWSGAYGPHFWIDPENDICAVFMKNSRFDGGAGNKSARRFEKAVWDALV